MVCDPGFKYSDIRLGNSWYPSPGFRLGFEVGYTMIDTAFSGQQVTLTKTTGARPVGAYTAKDLGITAVVFRANRASASDGPHVADQHQPNSQVSTPGGRPAGGS